MKLFSVIYFELTDKLGHKYGPFSPEVNKVLHDLDPTVGDLVTRLGQGDLDDVNVVIVSDHGMIEVSSFCSFLFIMKMILTS